MTVGGASAPRLFPAAQWDPRGRLHCRTQAGANSQRCDGEVEHGVAVVERVAVQLAVLTQKAGRPIPDDPPPAASLSG